MWQASNPPEPNLQPQLTLSDHKNRVIRSQMKTTAWRPGYSKMVMIVIPLYSYSVILAPSGRTRLTMLVFPFMPHVYPSICVQLACPRTCSYPRTLRLLRIPPGYPDKPNTLAAERRSCEVGARTICNIWQTSTPCTSAEKWNQIKAKRIDQKNAIIESQWEPTPHNTELWAWPSFDNFMLIRDGREVSNFTGHKSKVRLGPTCRENLYLKRD